MDHNRICLKGTHLLRTLSSSFITRSRQQFLLAISIFDEVHFLRHHSNSISSFSLRSGRAPPPGMQRTNSVRYGNPPPPASYEQPPSYPTSPPPKHNNNNSNPNTNPPQPSSSNPIYSGTTIPIQRSAGSFSL